MRWLRHLLFIPPVAAGIGLFSYAIAQKEAPARINIEEYATPVAVIDIRPRPFTPSVIGYGSVTPGKIWHAVPQVGGRVVELHENFVRGGDVSAGDLLVRLASDDYELAVERAQAQIEAARASITELDVSGINIERMAALEVKKLEIAKRELVRQEQLVARGTVGASRVDEQSRFVLEQEGRIQELRNQQRLLPQQRLSLEQNIKLTQADLARAELDLERTRIVAPFDGRVSMADIEVSQFVQAGVNIGIVDGIATAEVDAQFPGPSMQAFMRLAFGPKTTKQSSGESGYVHIKRLSELAGLNAQVAIDFAGDAISWDAHVSRISDTIDPKTRTVGLILSISDPYGSARPGERPPLIKGMFTRARLHASAIPEMIVIPRAAIQNDQVMVVGEDDRLEHRPIDVRAYFGDFAVIAGGLAAGDRLITSEPQPAIDGMRLRWHIDEELTAWLIDGHH